MCVCVPENDFTFILCDVLCNWLFLLSKDEKNPHLKVEGDTNLFPAHTKDPGLTHLSYYHKKRLDETLKL